MKIFGLIGWKNSGKTYFAQQIIQQMSSQNFRVASIKHAHHNFDIDKPGTDSYLHRQAGSQQIIISSSKRWAKITELNKSKEKTMEKEQSDEINKAEAKTVKEETDTVKAKTETEQIEIDSEKIKHIETMEDEEAELK